MEQSTQSKVWVAVKDAGVSANKNAKYRRKMEDEHVLEDQFGGASHQAYFGVYDGHGGQTAAVFCKTRLHLVFEENFKSLSDEDLINPEKMCQVVTNCYKKTDEEMKPTIPAAGACVVTCIIRSVNDHRYLYVANAGDSRAVLSRGGTAIRLTHDHKPTDETEKQRILDLKGFIDKDQRVNGLIAVSRALGDHHMKGPGKDFILGDPYFQLLELTPEDDYLILACDGVWDVIEDQAAVDMIRSSSENASSKAKLLVTQSIKSGSQDNCSVIVVQL
jgi:protein phosphatase PTC1